MAWSSLVLRYRNHLVSWPGLVSLLNSNVQNIYNTQVPFDATTKMPYVRLQVISTQRNYVQGDGVNTPRGAHSDTGWKRMQVDVVTNDKSAPDTGEQIAQQIIAATEQFDGGSNSPYVSGRNRLVSMGQSSDAQYQPPVHTWRLDFEMWFIDNT